MKNRIGTITHSIRNIPRPRDVSFCLILLFIRVIDINGLYCIGNETKFHNRRIDMVAFSADNSITRVLL